jgi:hypothetical protein
MTIKQIQSLLGLTSYRTKQLLNDLDGGNNLKHYFGCRAQVEQVNNFFDLGSVTKHVLSS